MLTKFVKEEISVVATVPKFGASIYNIIYILAQKPAFGGPLYSIVSTIVLPNFQ